MTEIKTGFSLEKLNTFGIRANASYYARVTSEEETEELAGSPVFMKNQHLILGGGSNLLFTGDFTGLVIQPGFEGMEFGEEAGDYLFIRAGAGVPWDDFVKFAVEHNLGGAENLSGIPGTVGASPIQNIGAYGAEAGDIIDRVEGFDFQQRSWRTLRAAECRFSYRNSIFKTDYRNSFLVSYVTFRLKKDRYELKTHYGTLGQELEEGDRSLSSLREVILRIRASKLPDVRERGNAGSFFKNPVVGNPLAERLRGNFPDMPIYPEQDGTVKLSAAWLIDQAGLKGFRMGKAAVHDKQPLVLVNMGGAGGKEILELSHYIREEVKQKFEILLEPEVNII